MSSRTTRPGSSGAFLVRYLELGSIPALQRELREQGIVTRPRHRSSGATVGSVPLTNGPLSYILKNRHYLGEINHRGRAWPGEHAAIIDQARFDAVQAKLAENLNRRSNRKLSSGALLMGKLFDDRGNPMSPTHAVKKGVRYRYYVSAPIAQGRKQEAGSVGRVPAVEIEAQILDALLRAGGKQSPALPDGVMVDDEASRRARISDQLDRVVVHPERLEIRMKRVDADGCAEIETISIAWRKPDSVRRREIIVPAESVDRHRVKPIRIEEQSRLLKAIDLARVWLNDLITGKVEDIASIARRERKTERSVRMTLSLAFLDPAIVGAAAEGKLPRGYGVSRLVDLPPAFADQWTALGLVRPSV